MADHGDPTPEADARKRDPTRGLAALSLALGLLGLLIMGLAAPFAIIFAVWAFARHQTRGRMPPGVWMALVGIVAGAVALTLWVPVFVQMRQKAHGTYCRSGIEQLGLSMLIYAQDHDNRLPPRGTWCDALMRYTQNRQIFRCPSAPERECGYAYSEYLDGVSLKDVWVPGMTVMLFDANTTWNGSGRPAIVALRHEHEAYAVVVDGSVHRLCYNGLAGWRPGNGPERQ